MTKIIAFTGLRYSGKTTAANRIIEEYGSDKAMRISFADPLRVIAEEVFGWDGKKDEKGRILLQRIGTECGRFYDEDIWVKKFLDRLETIPPEIEYILIDDCRFDNEAEVLKMLGAKLIKVVKITPKKSLLVRLKNLIMAWLKRDVIGSHASEQGVDVGFIDRIVLARDVDELENKVMEYVRTIE